jgi:hypothetical protein
VISFWLISSSLLATRKLNNNSLSGVLPDSLASIDGFALVYALESRFIVSFSLSLFQY